MGSGEGMAICNIYWKQLLTGTVPINHSLLTRTVPVISNFTLPPPKETEEDKQRR